MITQTQLKKLLIYIPETGRFLRIEPVPNNPSLVVNGNLHPQGFLRFSLEGTTYKYHKLVWLYHGGKYDDRLLHIDGDKTNNRIENLMNRYNRKPREKLSESLIAITIRHEKEFAKAQGQVDRLQLVQRRECREYRQLYSLTTLFNTDDIKVTHIAEMTIKKDHLLSTMLRHEHEMAEFLSVVSFM